MTMFVRQKEKRAFLFREIKRSLLPGVGILLGILGGGVSPGSPNPNPISDPKNVTLFSTPVFRPEPLGRLGRNYVIIT